MRLTTHTYAEKENRVGRMLQRAAFFILHSSFFNYSPFTIHYSLFTNYVLFES